MAGINENPEAAGSSESGGQAEQKVGAEQFEQVQSAELSAEVSKDARMWAMFCHLAGLAGFVVPVIFASIIAPLIVWQIKKDEFPFVDQQGKEAVNFQISILIYGLAAGLLCLVCVGFVLLPAVGIFKLVFLLIAAVKTNSGQAYRYPLCIRFIK